MASPFTFTPGMAGKAYINMHYTDEIADSFDDPESERYVYKILGLRGSGKSVVYSKLINATKAKEAWKVYTISAGVENPHKSLIGQMSKDGFISSYDDTVKLSAEAGAEGNVLVAKGSGKVAVEVERAKNPNLYSDESTIKDMVRSATKKGFKILIGIDDIVKSEEMVSFLSLIGDMILDEERDIYLLCTGTTKNIEDFAAEPHLSFFVRGNKIEIAGLSMNQMALKYAELLGAPLETAKALARYTKGYAYAYQVLGELCYTHGSTDIQSFEQEFDASLADQYDLIFKGLADSEKEFLRAVVLSESGAAKDIQKNMTNQENYNVLRSRLSKKHLVNASIRGILTVDLPRIKEYFTAWQL